jgi:hypothetical protein
MTSRSKLRREMRQFRKKKVFIAIPVILLGLLGLVLPVIPGLALIFVGVLLLFPKTGDQILSKFKKEPKIREN